MATPRTLVISLTHRLRPLLSRWALGSLTLGALLALLLFFSIGQLPEGISRAEAASAVNSATLSLHDVRTGAVAELPYRLVQKLSLHFFGVTPLGIRLPSALLALAAGLMLAALLRWWFSTTIALLSSFLAITSVPFLTVGRLGAPLVMLVFWMVLLLLAATHIVRGSGRLWYWRLCFVVAAALSLYTPLMLFPLLALAVAGALHPHARYVFGRVGWLKKTSAMTLAVLLLAPLGWGLLSNAHTIGHITGFTGTVPSLGELIDRPVQLLRGLLGSGTMPLGVLAAPAIGYALASIMLLGVFRVVRDHHSVRSYMLIVWLASLLPAVLWQPEHVVAYIVPAILLVAIGLEGLVSEWYSLFPRNPYARAAALVPLSILLASIATASLTQYIDAQQYSPNIVAQYPYRLTLVRSQLDAARVASADMVVPPGDIAFYRLLQRDYGWLHVWPAGVEAAAQPTFVVHAPGQPAAGGALRLVTSGASHDALVMSRYR